MVTIVITGTPGTGKSTHAKKLAEELGASVVNITKLLQERGLDSEFDAKHNCFIVDMVKLNELLENIVRHESNVIIDGHLSHYLNPDLVDQCICMKCDLPELRKRLEARGYEQKKVRDNLDCEIFDVCFEEAVNFGLEPKIVWTSDKPVQVD